MSLETEIAALTSTGKALIDTFNGKKAGIDSALAAAVAAAPAISRTFYIDQVAGDDAAAGTQAAPLKTLGQAIANTPGGGVLDAVLLSDYAHETTSIITSRRVTIRGDSGASNTRKLILKDFPVAGAGTKRLGSFQIARSSSLDFADLTLVLPDNAGLNLPLDGYYAMMYAGGNTMPGFASIKFYNCVWALTGTFAGKICGASWASLSLTAINTTFPTALEGSIVHSVPALKDPNTIPWLLTNISRL
ncbi:hypothetical protein [Pseudomonas sp. B22(2017)]|uniref:hypothetical protein n=1 Tax=Pseudomonas sp. B22(2017) TaxID=1981736 RepID=UPI000A1D7B4B|nr:hypothetical protein [Pseudomonas sp. B22(2017)]